jgi:hypothetical protein
MQQCRDALQQRCYSGGGCWLLTVASSTAAAAACVACALWAAWRGAVRGQLAATALQHRAGARVQRGPLWRGWGSASEAAAASGGVSASALTVGLASGHVFVPPNTQT